MKLVDVTKVLIIILPALLLVGCGTPYSNTPTGDNYRKVPVLRISHEEWNAKSEQERIAIEKNNHVILTGQASEDPEVKKRQLSDAQDLIDLINAKKKNNVTCRNDAECRKAFALTQIYIDSHSDQKIQIATDTIVETYNSTDEMNVAMKGIKKPGRGTASTITIFAVCKGMEYNETHTVLGELATKICMIKLTLIYNGFRPYIMESL